MQPFFYTEFMKTTLLFIFLCMTLACGVKGPPRPPLKPATLGRGKPNYSGATKDLNYKSITSDEADESNDKKKKKKDEN